MNTSEIISNLTQTGLINHCSKNVRETYVKLVVQLTRLIGLRIFLKQDLKLPLSLFFGLITVVPSAKLFFKYSVILHISVLSLKLLWLQIMSNVGAHLEELNLGGSIMSQLTDEGLKAVPKYCTSLKVTCVTFLIYVDIHVDLNYSIIQMHIF